ncbi:MFS transporter [Pseudomonas aeruginosa]|uniref:MFS transporter n=1 Tax=Pseudomonas aeruginosa TaxID=287 RepID=UPI00106B97F1|nr:MFS transporter [Pseudomonas aeruginosa]
MNSSQGFPRLALFLCGCAAFLNLYTTQGIFDELAASFHISAHQSNWSITATTLAVALAAPFVGRLSGGRERSRVIAFAASLLCVPMLLAAHAGSFAAFLLWRFAEGMLIPLLFASSVAYIGERWSGGAVIELTSLYVAGTILGGFAGRFLTGLLTEEWDWRVAFRILAGLTLLIAVAIRSLLPANSGRHAPAPGKRPLVSRELFRAPLLSSYAVGFCVLFSQVAMFTYIGIHLSRPPYSLDTAQLGSIYAVFLLALLVIPASGRLARTRPHRQLLLGASLLGVCGSLLTLAPGLPTILVGLALSATGVFLAQSTVNAFTASNAGTDKAGAVGLYLTCYYAGGSLGAVLPAPFWERWGWPGCLGLILLAQLLPLLLTRYGWSAPQAERAALRASQGRP